MAQPSRRPAPIPAPASVEVAQSAHSRRYRQGYRILHVAVTLFPLVVGTDKFLHLLTNWDQYLAPAIPQMLGIRSHTFLLGTAGFELAQAVGLALKPRVFAYVFAGWLGIIILNLVTTGRYYDIAFRDFLLLLGSLALARISPDFDRP